MSSEATTLEWNKEALLVIKFSKFCHHSVSDCREWELHSSNIAKGKIISI